MNEKFEGRGSFVDAVLAEVPEQSVAHIILVNARRDIAAADDAQGEQRTIEALHNRSVRREALKKVYGRIIAQLQGDPFERLIFIQCFAALDASEGHCLVGIYADEFNRTLIEYQEAMEHDVD